MIKILRYNSLHKVGLYRFSTDPLDMQQKLNQNNSQKSIYELPQAQKYIENQVRKLDWVTYTISKHYPQQIRQDFLNVSHFGSELARIEESVSETSLGLGKLDFWSNAIDSIYKDAPIKDPLIIALHHSCVTNMLPKHLFTKMVQGRRSQIQAGSFADLKAMAAVAEINRGPTILLYLRLLRQNSDSSELQDCVEQVSRAVGILDYVRRIPYTLKKLKLPIPVDILQKHSINVRTLWNRIDGKPKEELYDAILEVSAFARQSLIQAQTHQDKLPPQAFRAFLHASDAQYYLETLEKFNFLIFEKALNTNSYVELPLRIFQNARNQKFMK